MGHHQVVEASQARMGVPVWGQKAGRVAECPIRYSILLTDLGSDEADQAAQLVAPLPGIVDLPLPVGHVSEGIDGA